jgi:AcrR family transcriptional regulator
MARTQTMSDEEIVARSRPVFVEWGFAARTKQVAAAVGLTWGAIALRFGSKQALFVRAMAVEAAGPQALDAFMTGERPAEVPLRTLLERLRAQLWERWPRVLQVRMAASGLWADFEADRLARPLSEALGAHAVQGAVRSDLGAEVLAHLVLSLLTGHVAQRFMARERALGEDPVLIDGVMRLLAAA